MSSERLARLVEFGGSNNMDSLLVTRHGRACWRRPTRRSAPA